MASHDLYEVMSTLRAVRRLRPDPIPADVLDRVLQAACWAPTGGNMQPWRIIVVRSPEHKQALAELYGPEWKTYTEFGRRRAERQQLPEADRAKLERTLAAGDYLADHLAEAPVILLFIADPAMMAITDKNLDRISMVGGGSVYTAVQNAMLACGAEGLGCTLTTLHCLREPEVKAALEHPRRLGDAGHGADRLPASGAVTARSPAARRASSSSTTPSALPGPADPSGRVTGTNAARRRDEYRSDPPSRRSVAAQLVHDRLGQPPTHVGIGELLLQGVDDVEAVDGLVADGRDPCMSDVELERGQHARRAVQDADRRRSSHVHDRRDVRHVVVVLHAHLGRMGAESGVPVAVGQAPVGEPALQRQVTCNAERRSLDHIPPRARPLVGWTWKVSTIVPDAPVSPLLRGCRDRAAPTRRRCS